MTSKPNDVRVEYATLSTLGQHPHSPFRATAKQIRMGLKAAREFGFNVPLLIDDSKQVLSSPYRLKVAQELGLEQVPVIAVGHLTQSQVRAFQIAEQKIGEQTETDTQLLRQELELILSEEPLLDLDILGIEQPELDIILNMDEEAEEAEALDAPALMNNAPDVARGDIWQLGKHALVCGSCLDEASWTALGGALDPDSCDSPEGSFGASSKLNASLILTDPPYNVKVKGHVSTSSGPQFDEFAMASGEMSDAEFDDFLASFLARSTGALRDGGLLMSFMDWRHFAQLDGAAKAANLHPVNMAVWAKDQAGMGSFLRSQHELVGIYRHGTSSHQNNVQLGKNGRYRTNLWSYPAVRRLGRQVQDGEEGQMDLARLHPTVKPVALLQDAILDCTSLGDLVLDPFAGSGSLLIAAERSRRRAGLIEIDPKYAGIVIARYEAFTGDTAQKVGVIDMHQGLRASHRPSDTLAREVCHD